jgi:DNA-binding transcriptional ArsR family regulator
MPASATSPFDAIADPTRRKILDALRSNGPMRAGDLASRFPRISRPGVSKHLRILRGARLLRSSRRGRELWYRLDPAPLSQVDKWMQQYAGFWEDKLQQLKRAAEE